MTNDINEKESRRSSWQFEKFTAKLSNTGDRLSTNNDTINDNNHEKRYDMGLISSTDLVNVQSVSGRLDDEERRRRERYLAEYIQAVKRYYYV